MKEIEFTIDEATGELVVHIKGIKGPACTQYAKLVAEYLGKPAKEENTAEYAVKVVPIVQPRRS